MLITNIPEARQEAAQASLDRMDALAFAHRTFMSIVDVACRGAVDLRPEIGPDHSAMPYIKQALASVKNIASGISAAAIVEMHAQQIREKDDEITRLKATIRAIEAERDGEGA